MKGDGDGDDAGTAWFPTRSRGGRRRAGYLAAIDVLDGGFPKQKVHVILGLEASDELRIVEPSESNREKFRV